MATLDYDRAAAVLVEAAYQGDAAAAARWGVSPRTIRNYRARMEGDSQLAALFQEKRQLVERDWAAGLTDVIRDGATFIRRAAKEGDPSDPDMVHAVAGGMKLVAEIVFAKQMLDARLRVLDAGDSGQYRPGRPQIAEVASEGEYADADGDA